ncbi:hypothetical protein [Novosphingobium sp. TCA1]|uniref:hypothetical protein n=1 Tax=Novosphingobium sp. TCA1 TaxID=2682474 RepID=UPI00135CD113|nr:hypothetical protein [Novosphingobium sp. TCA1]
MRRRALSTALSLVTALVALSACRIIPESPQGRAAPLPAPAETSPTAPAPDMPGPDPQTLPDQQVPDRLPSPAGTQPPTDFYTPQASAQPPAPAGPYSGPPLAYTRIGETIYVDGPRVTPLALLEDSRCAEGTQCVWAGRLRVRVRVDLGSGPREMEMTLGQPVQVADGQLDLLDALPRPVAGSKPAPFAYQFGFRFMGGL